MRALRRVTRADERESNLITQIGLQAVRSRDEGEISHETCRELLNVLLRVHTGILVRTGIVARKKQRRYDARVGGLAIHNMFDLFVAGSLLALIAAWIWLL